MQAPIWQFSSCHIGQSPSQPSSQTAITRSEADPPKGNMTLNPKAMVFAFAIFPPLASVRAAAPYLAAFAATATVVSCVWLLLGGAAGRLGEHFAHYLPRAAALAVSLFAVILVGSALAAHL